MLKNCWMAGATLMLLAAGATAMQPPAKSPDVKKIQGATKPSDVKKIQGATKPPSVTIAGRLVAASSYWLGIECLPVTPALRAQLNLPRRRQGVLVAAVVPDGPGAKAGIAQYDVLLRAGNRRLNGPYDLMQAIDAAKNNKLKIELIRGGKPKTIEATPAKRSVGIGGKAWSLPPNMSVAIDLERKKPAKIAVKYGDKKWNLTEKNLDRLPADVRPHVERLLGSVSGAYSSGKITVTGPTIRGEAEPKAGAADLEADWETVQKWLESMAAGQAGKDPKSPMQFRFLYPGAIVPKDVIAPPKPLPKNMSVVISREGKQPAKIVVKRGKSKWEVTEKELKKLPSSVRPHVERILGRQLEGIIITGGVHARADASDKTSPVQQSLNLTNSRLKKLERRLAKMNRNTAQKTSQVQRLLNLTNSQLRQMERQLDEINRHIGNLFKAMNKMVKDRDDHHKAPQKQKKK